MDSCAISLYSAENQFSDEGAKVIGLALQSNTTLTSLKLKGKEWIAVQSHSILQTIRLVLTLNQDVVRMPN